MGISEGVVEGDGLAGSIDGFVELVETVMSACQLGKIEWLVRLHESSVLDVRQRLLEHTALHFNLIALIVEVCV